MLKNVVLIVHVITSEKITSPLKINLSPGTLLSSPITWIGTAVALLGLLGHQHNY